MVMTQRASKGSDGGLFCQENTNGSDGNVIKQTDGEF